MPLFPRSYHLYNSRMFYSTIFFDLDGTLYDGDNGLWEEIGLRMNTYMEEKLGLPEKKVSDLRKQYFHEYGTTLSGLQKHHGVDAYEYLAYVHDIPLDEYLEEDLELRDSIIKLPQERWIFTNADRDHAERVLSALGLSDCFHGIIDIHATEYACKPHSESFIRALTIARSPDVEKCVMIDDTSRNLQTAGKLGMTTVLITENSSEKIEVDYKIKNLVGLHKKIPGLV